MDKHLVLIAKGGMYVKPRVHPFIVMSDAMHWEKDYDTFEELVDATIASYKEMYSRAGADCIIMEQKEFMDMVNENYFLIA